MICALCGGEVPATANRCPRCNSSLRSRAPVTGVLTPPPPPNVADDDVTSLGGNEQTGLPNVGGPGDDAETGAAGAPKSATAANAGPLAAGQAFGSRYHITRLLGIGGMGAVYQAWDAELGVAVAIKVIRPDVMADPGAAAEVERRFKRELLLARQVTHNNVVRIHDLGEIDGIKYITMPYVDGADLASVLKQDGRL